MAKKVMILFLCAISVVALCTAVIFIKLAYDYDPNAFSFMNIDNNKNQNNSSNTEIKNNSNINNDESSSTILELTSRGADNYLDDAVFIGDSRTQAMYIYGYLKNEQTFAKDGLSHINAYDERFVDIGMDKFFTISEALKIKSPKKIFVSFGINGILWFEKDTFIEEYKDLLEMIKSECPNSKIIVTSIIPVSESFQSYEGLQNTKIDDYNTGILDLAKRLNINYLDIASSLKNDKNCLDSAYDSGDGLHLNENAYVNIFETIYTHCVY